MNFQEKASFFPTFKKLKLIKFQSISVGTHLKENIKNRHQPVKNYIMKSDNYKSSKKFRTFSNLKSLTPQ